MVKNSKTESQRVGTTALARLRLAVVLLGAVLADKIAFRILWVPFSALSPNPGETGGLGYSLCLFFIPAISVGIAVMAARWIEPKLSTAPRDTLIFLVAAICTAILLSSIHLST